jgi:hypothetical protein
MPNSGITSAGCVLVDNWQVTGGWFYFPSPTSYPTGPFTCVTTQGGINGLPGAGGPAPLEAWLSQDGALPLHNTGFDTSNAATGTGITFAASSGFSKPVATYSGAGTGAVASSAAYTNFGNSSQFTVSAWVNLPNTSSGSIVSDIGNSGQTGWQVYVNSYDTFFGLINTNTTNAIYVAAPQSVASGTLRHVCAIYDGTGVVSGLHMYIDGASQIMATIWTPLTSSAASGLPVYIGAQGTAGVIGNVEIFANNTTSCTALYAAGPNAIY